jgi:hypothetical protein
MKCSTSGSLLVGATAAPERRVSRSAGCSFSLIIALLMIAGASADPAFADSIDYRGYMHLVGKLDGIDPSGIDPFCNMDVFGDFVYLACGRTGLQVVDVSDGSSPRLAFIARIPGMPRCDFIDLEVFDHYVYVLDKINGLVVFDIAVPDKPRFVRTHFVPHTPYKIIVHGGITYISLVFYPGRNILYIIDAADPVDPVTVGYLDLPGFPRGFVVDGTHAFIYTEFADLQAIDVSDPTSPHFIDQIDLPGTATNLTISGSYVYASSFYSILSAVDVSNPSNMTVVGSINASANYMTATGSKIFAGLGGGPAQFGVIDIGVPTHPVISARMAVPESRVVGVATSATTAYVLSLPDINDDCSLCVIDIRVPDMPDPVSDLALPHYAWDLDVKDEYCYVANYDAGLKIVDYSDISHPVVVGSANVDEAVNVAVQNQHAYVVNRHLTDYYDYTDLLVFDVSDPSHPTAVTTFELADFIYDIATTDDYAYLAADDLLVVDIQDPAHPQIVARTEFSGCGGSSVFLSGNVAYLSGSHRALHIVDITDPLHPAIVSSVTQGIFPSDIAVAGRFSFTADEYSGLHIIDITKPKHPFSCEVLEGLHPMRLSICDDVLYCVDGELGLLVMDISDPEHIERINNVSPNTFLRSVVVHNGFVYTAGSSGIVVYPTHLTAATPVRLSLFEAIRQGDEVKLRWAVAGNGEQAEFRLARGTGARTVELGYERDGCAWIAADEHVPSSGNDLAYTLYRKRPDGSLEFLGVQYVEPESVPALIREFSVHPNPFNPRTTISYRCDDTGTIRISIYDMQGKRVAGWTDNGKDTGLHEVCWAGVDESGKNVAAGTYMVRLEVQGQSAIAKVTLLK